MPPIPSVQSSVRARSKRILLSRRAPLAPSKLLQKQRIPHPSTPTKSLHHLQIPPLPGQMSRARAPSPHIPVPIPRHCADRQPRIPARVAHSQTPPPKAILLTLLQPALLTARPPRSVSRKLPPKPLP